jgi:hypothetical protein
MNEGLANSHILLQQKAWTGGGCNGIIKGRTSQNCHNHKSEVIDCRWYFTKSRTKWEASGILTSKWSRTKRVVMVWDLVQCLHRIKTMLSACQNPHDHNPVWRTTFGWGTCTSSREGKIKLFVQPITEIVRILSCEGGKIPLLFMRNVLPSRLVDSQLGVHREHLGSKPNREFGTRNIRWNWDITTRRRVQGQCIQRNSLLNTATAIWYIKSSKVLESDIPSYEANTSVLKLAQVSLDICTLYCRVLKRMS